jgi:copper transport protein
MNLRDARARRGSAGSDARIFSFPLRRAFICAALFTITAAAWAAPASAHAKLESSSPAPSSVVKVSPPQVVLHFDEDVETDFGSVRVYNATGERVDVGGARHPSSDPHDVAADLPAHLADGAYVVAWRVVSADSHPVHGAFIFSVGTAAGLPRASVLESALASSNGSSLVGVAYWLVRAAAFAGLLFLVGIVAIVLFVSPALTEGRRVRVCLWTAWATLVVATVLGLAIQGVYAAALPVGDALHPAVIREVLATRFGRVQLLRLGLLAAVIPMLLLTSRRRFESTRSRWMSTAWVLLGAALLATAGLAGHATTGPAVFAGFALDVVHLGAASLWLGGLAVLACLLTPNPEVDPTFMRTVARSISTIAFVAVLVVVASGTLQAVRQVGSLPELVDTDYGRILLVKVAFVLLLIALGGLSRLRLRRLSGASENSGARRLRLTVALELVVAFAVLAATALLVNASPARSQVNLPFTTSFTALGDQVNVIVSPSVAGVRNVLHVYVLGPTGRAKAVPELDAALSLPEKHLGPLVLPLTIAGVGHYRDRNVTFLTPGAWILSVTLRTSAIDEQVVQLPLPVR